MISEINSIYSKLDVSSKTVIDIGSFVGETILYFINRGAYVVHAYEPMKEYYEIIKDNINLNNISFSKVRLFNKGIWFTNTTLRLTICGWGSYIDKREDGKGLEVELVSLEYALKEAAKESHSIVVKMDCEGCEYSMLTYPCTTLRMAQEYLIEVHGRYSILVDYMEKCGFKPYFIEGNEIQSVWLFKLKHIDKATLMR